MFIELKLIYLELNIKLNWIDVLFRHMQKCNQPFSDFSKSISTENKSLYFKITTLRGWTNWDNPTVKKAEPNLSRCHFVGRMRVKINC